MTRLLRAELSRLRSRRLTRVAAVVILLAVAGLQFAVYHSVRPPSQAEQAQERANYESAKRDYQQHKAENDQAQQACIDEGNAPEQCSGAPTLSDFQRTPTPFREITTLAVTVSVILTGMSFLFVGASFIGAEYSSGSLSNWLSFIPSRGKVFTAKILAVTIVAAAVSVVAIALTIGVAALLSRLVHLPVTGTAKLAQLGGRGILVGMICAVIGFCLALLTRHTIAAAGTLLGYLFVSFVLNGLSSVISGLQQFKPFLPQNNLAAFLNHGYTYTEYDTTVTDQGLGTNGVERTITFAHSAGYWAVIVIVLVGLSLMVFRRRDVS
jgi:ABC-2 type transport system permease protein